MRRGIFALALLFAAGFFLPVPVAADEGLTPDEQAVVAGLNTEMRKLYDAVRGANPADTLKGRKAWIAFWKEAQTSTKVRTEFIATRNYFYYLTHPLISDFKAKFVPQEVNRKYSVVDDEYIRLVGLYVIQRACRMTFTCQNEGA